MWMNGRKEAQRMSLFRVIIAILCLFLVHISLTDEYTIRAVENSHCREFQMRCEHMSEALHNHA